MNDLSFLIALGTDPPSNDIELGIKVTILGMSQVFIGLILLVVMLNLFQIVSDVIKRIRDKKPILDDYRKPRADLTAAEQMKPAFKLEIGRQPSTEEVAAIAASLYMQSIEMEAERRYIRSYKRRKQVLHAWKESSKFQLYNRNRR